MILDIRMGPTRLHKHPHKRAEGVLRTQRRRGEEGAETCGCFIWSDAATSQGMQQPPEAGKVTAVFPAGFRGNLDFVPVTLILGLQTCARINLFQGNPVGSSVTAPTGNSYRNKQDTSPAKTLPTKVRLVKAMVFPVVCMDVRVGP